MRKLLAISGLFCGAAAIFSAAYFLTSEITAVEYLNPLRGGNNENFRNGSLERTYLIEIRTTKSNLKGDIVKNNFAYFGNSELKTSIFDRTAIRTDVFMGTFLDGPIEYIISDLDTSDGALPCNAPKAPPSSVKVKEVEEIIEGKKVKSQNFLPPVRNFNRKNIYSIYYPEHSELVTCSLNDLSTKSSFTERRAQVGFPKKDDGYTSRSNGKYTFINYNSPWPIIDTLIPIEKVDVSWSPMLGENININGNYKYDHPNEENFGPGDQINISWENRLQKQWRDILLVIIGGLVGMGTGLVIEGVRSLFSPSTVKPPKTINT